MLGRRIHGTQGNPRRDTDVHLLEEPLLLLPLLLAEGRGRGEEGTACAPRRRHENAAEDNLVFLCLEHHDEYDSTTRLSKGLREQEVRGWRDELYKEMEYRFRT